MLLTLIAALTLGQGVAVKGGASTDLASVNTQKALETVTGKSARATYICSAGALVTTALYNLSVEAPAANNVRILGWCVGASTATAAAAVTVTLQRRTTASTGGTAATAEGTATPAVSKMDPADSNFGGICRLTSTLGTAGAVLDQVGFQTGVVASQDSLPVFCRGYEPSSGKAPLVLAGVANGVSLNVSAPGAGGLASGSISIVFAVE
jgi:hypothetical protein